MVFFYIGEVEHRIICEENENSWRYFYGSSLLVLLIMNALSEIVNMRRIYY